MQATITKRRLDGPILVVEDSDEDFEALSWAVRKLEITQPMIRCVDGEDALEYLFRRGRYADPGAAPRPALILLDLNLTVADGCEVLEQIKGDERLKTIPAVVWTTSNDPSDVNRCYRGGANSYLLKPVDMQTFLGELEALTRYWFDIVILPGDAGPE